MCPVLRRAEPVDRFELGKPEPLPLPGDEGGRPGALPASGSSPLRGRTGRAVLSRSQVSRRHFTKSRKFSHRPHVYDVHGGFTYNTGSRLHIRAPMVDSMKSLFHMCEIRYRRQCRHVDRSQDLSPFTCPHLDMGCRSQ